MTVKTNTGIYLFVVYDIETKKKLSEKIHTFSDRELLIGYVDFKAINVTLPNTKSEFRSIVYLPDESIFFTTYNPLTKRPFDLSTVKHTHKQLLTVL